MISRGSQPAPAVLAGRARRILQSPCLGTRKARVSEPGVHTLARKSWRSTSLRVGRLPDKPALGFRLVRTAQLRQRVLLTMPRTKAACIMPRIEFDGGPAGAALDSQLLGHPVPLSQLMRRKHADSGRSIEPVAILEQPIKFTNGQRRQVNRIARAPGASPQRPHR